MYSGECVHSGECVCTVKNVYHTDIYSPVLVCIAIQTVQCFLTQWEATRVDQAHQSKL